MFFTLKPVNPLRRNRTQQSCLLPTPRLCTRPLTNAPHRHLGNPNFLPSPNITPLALRSRVGNGRWVRSPNWGNFVADDRRITPGAM